MISTADFKKSFGILFAEAFGVAETPAGFFLDTGQSGLLGTIDQISAATASRPFRPDQETIASHCGHVLFLLNFFAAFERGEAPEPDWAGSWATREVDDAAWARLRADLRSAYTTVATRLQAREDWHEQAVGASMMLLAHCSYHVGVIHKLHTTIVS